MDVENKYTCSIYKSNNLKKAAIKILGLRCQNQENRPFGKNRRKMTKRDNAKIDAYLFCNILVKEFF